MKKLFNGRQTALEDATPERNSMLSAMVQQLGYTSHSADLSAEAQHFLVNWHAYSEGMSSTIHESRMVDTGLFELDIKTFDEFVAEIVRVMDEPVTYEFKLNDDYTAKITGTEIKVGCQRFELDTIRNLVKYAESVQK